MIKLEALFAVLGTLALSRAINACFKVNQIEIGDKYRSDFYRMVVSIVAKVDKHQHENIIKFVFFLVLNIDNKRIFLNILRRSIRKRRSRISYFDSKGNIADEIRVLPDEYRDECNRLLALFMIINSHRVPLIGSWFLSIFNLFANSDITEFAPRRLKIGLYRIYNRANVDMFCLQTITESSMGKSIGLSIVDRLDAEVSKI